MNPTNTQSLPNLTSIPSPTFCEYCASSTPLYRLLFPTPTISLLPPYTGNPFHWPLFWATYQDQIESNTAFSDVEKFRILYASLDAKTRSILGSVDPKNPKMKQVTKAILGHIYSYDTMYFDTVDQIKSMRLPKALYQNKSWSLLLETARLAKLLFSRAPNPSNFLLARKAVAMALVKKLPPAYIHDYLSRWFNQSTAPSASASNSRDNLDLVIQICSEAMAVNASRVPPESGLAPNWCPYCERDYHWPIDCDFIVGVASRRATIRQKSLCQSCLEVVPSGSWHECEVWCSQCGDWNHHESICERI